MGRHRRGWVALLPRATVALLVVAPLAGPAAADEPGSQPADAADASDAADAADAATGLRLVSRGTDGAPGRRPSYAPDVSGTGRLVVLSSDAPLVADDDNGRRDVYLYDRRTRGLTLLTRTPSGEPANGGSDNPRITRDGRFVVLESTATDLVGGRGAGIYRIDRRTGTTSFVAPDAVWASVSDDGAVVAYNRAGGYVFLKDLRTGVETLVSHAYDDPDEPVAQSWFPEVSSNGRFVAFFCYYDDIVAEGDDNGVRDVFRYDRRTGRSALVSRTPDGTSGNGASEDVALSADGRRAVFWSAATDLVDAPLDGTWQVYVTDLRSGEVELVSVDPRGRPGDESSFVPTISGDGRRVAFSSTADLVKGTPTTTYDVYLRDLDVGTTRLVSRTRDGAGGDGWSQVAALDHDGSLVAFASEATDLLGGGAARRYQVYVDRTGLG